MGCRQAGRARRNRSSVIRYRESGPIVGILACDARVFWLPGFVTGTDRKVRHVPFGRVGQRVGLIAGKTRKGRPRSGLSEATAPTPFASSCSYVIHAVLREKGRKQGRYRRQSPAGEEEIGTRSGDIAIKIIFLMVASMLKAHAAVLAMPPRVVAACITGLRGA